MTTIYGKSERDEKPKKDFIIGDVDEILSTVDKYTDFTYERLRSELLNLYRA